MLRFNALLVIIRQGRIVGLRHLFTSKFPPLMG